MKKFYRKKVGVLSLSIVSTTLCLLYVLKSQFSLTNASEEFKRANTRENIPKHINLINGTFEEPEINTVWAYIRPMNMHTENETYIEGWNIACNETDIEKASSSEIGENRPEKEDINTGKFSDFSNYVELKKLDYTSNNPNQSLELVSEEPVYVYQNFETTAKQKLYINFDYRSSMTDNEKLKVYMAEKDEARNESNLIFEKNATTDWKNQTLTYTIPEGREESSIGFFTEERDYRTSGVNIDNVDIKTGAYLLVEESSNKALANIKDGNSIRYNIKIKNYGQLAAGSLSLFDILDGSIKSISELKLGEQAISSYSVEDNRLKINLDSRLLIEPNEEINVSYVAQIDSDKLSKALYDIKTQMQVNYRDYAYGELRGEDKAYSNVYEQQIYKTMEEKNNDVAENISNINSSDSNRFVSLSDKADKEKKLEIETKLENPASLAVGGAKLKYGINVKNKGDKPLKNIWLRAYVPKYTNYLDSDSLGEYGYVNKREHITWYIDEIPAGEEKKLYYDVSVDYCIGGSIETDTYYEILDEGTKPYYNTETNPKNRLD